MLSRFLNQQPTTAGLRLDRLVEAAHAQLDAERYSLTPAGKSALTRAFEQEAVAFVDRLQRAMSSEEVLDDADVALHQHNKHPTSCGMTPRCSCNCNRGEC